MGFELSTDLLCAFCVYFTSLSVTFSSQPPATLQGVARLH